MIFLNTPRSPTKKGQLESEPCIVTSLFVDVDDEGREGKGRDGKGRDGKGQEEGKKGGERKKGRREGKESILYSMSESLQDCDYFGITDPAEA